MKPQDVAQDAPTSVSAGGRRSLVKRLIPVLILAAIVAAIFVLGLDEYLAWDALKENYGALSAFVSEQGLLAVLVYILVYTVVTAASLPGALWLSLAGGLLFGQWLGTLSAVVGATLGATIIFLIAKTAFGEPLRARAGPALKKMEAGFQENAFNYLLVLRLIPLFPFFLVNLVPAFLGVKLRTFVVATFFGIIPGAFVYVLSGAGLKSVIESNEEFSPAGILTPEVIGALVGLALLAVVPVIYKKVKQRKGAA